jgi:hypothetical protein
MELKEYLIKHMKRIDAIESKISELETKSENEIKLLKNQNGAQQKPLELR